MTTYDFRSVSVNNLNSQAFRRPRKNNQRSASTLFWDAKAFNDHEIYFMSNPLDEENDGGFAGWLQAFVGEGFVGGIKPGPGMYSVPLGDWDDPLLELITPYVGTYNKTGKPRVEASYKFGANIFDTSNEPGGHRIMVMSKQQWEKIKSKFDSYREINPDYSPAGEAFRLVFEDGTNDLKIVPVDRPKIDLPPVLNIRDLLQQRQEAVLNHIDANLSSAESTPTEDVSYTAEVPDVTETAVDFADVPVEADTPVEASYHLPSLPPPDYANVPAPKLRALLISNGVKVSPKATHDELVALAVDKL